MLRALSASLRTLPRRPLTATPARLHTSQPAMAAFQQDPHDLLVIPGPIEVANSVLYANAHPSMSHVSKDFVPVFGDSIRMTREVLYAGETTQPFLISGSGTLGWDQVAANLVEDGEEALVLHSGYFADSFADWCVTPVRFVAAGVLIVRL